MSHPIPATLYRIAAVPGGGSAVILLINAAKRAEIIRDCCMSRRHLSWLDDRYRAICKAAGTELYVPSPTA